MTDSTADSDRLTLVHWEIRPPNSQPPIRGDLHTAGGAQPRSALVICHGFKGFRGWGFFPALARAAARRGHAVVTFDFSRNGLGEDGVDFSALDLFSENTHSRNVEEIGIVLDVLRGGRLLPHSPRRIGLLGHSRGGGEAVLASARDPRVDALVTWAAIADIPGRWSEEQVARWRSGRVVEVANARTGQQMPMGPGYWRDIEENAERLNITAAARELDIPWLIVHGEDDESVSAQEARMLHAAGGPRAEILLVPGTGHTFGAVHPYAGATNELRTVVDATLAWFDVHLR